MIDTPAMWFVFTSLPAGEGDTFARALVEMRAAACVNVLASQRSVYRWQGAVEVASEDLLCCKTAHPERLSSLIAARHPYELPEIVVVAVDAVRTEPRYAAWVAAMTTEDTT